MTQGANRHGITPEIGDLVRLDKRQTVPQCNEKREITHYISPTTPFHEYTVLNNHTIYLAPHVLEIIRKGH